MKPYYDQCGQTILHGDCVAVMRSFPADHFDTVITDPPYHLTSGKRGGSGEKSLNLNSPAGRSRVTTGFMGKAWDGGDVAFRVETWQEVLRVCKPGAMLLAFGGTRTFHRLTCAIEDAGWEIRDAMSWLYGSGFPKSLDISKAIDKRPGASLHDRFRLELSEARKRHGLSRQDVSLAVVGTRSGACWNWEHHQFPEARHWPRLKSALPSLDDKWEMLLAEAEREVVGKKQWNNSASHFVPGEDHSQRVHLDVTAPGSDAAHQWDGWGTAMKPAWEPILLCQKPLKVVPRDDIVGDINHLIGVALCLLLSDAKSAERLSKLSPSELSGASVSVATLAAVLYGAECVGSSEMTAIFKSPAAGRTCLNIARSRSAILDAHLNHTSTFTIETRTSLTIGLQTLRCLLSATIPESITRAAFQAVGLKSDANSAASGSSGVASNTSSIPKPFAAVIASLRTGENSTNAKSAAETLLRTIQSVDSVLNHVLQRITTECVESSRLNPDWRPIIVAMKPLDGTFAQNAEKWGVAGMHIDGARIDCDSRPLREIDPKASANGVVYAGRREAGHGFDGGSRAAGNTSLGRFPANVLLDKEAAELLDAQTGVLESGEPAGIKAGGKLNCYGTFAGGIPVTGYGDSGGASRFFYTAKASRSDRGVGNDHPTVKPLDLIKYLCRLTETPTGGKILDPFGGSMTTLVAAREVGRPAVGIDIEESHCRIGAERLCQGVLFKAEDAA